MGERCVLSSVIILKEVLNVATMSTRHSTSTVIDMATTNDIVKARIDHDVKVQATETLKAMGLSVSDAIRLLMLKIAEEKALPFVVGVPNKATLQAMEELEQGKSKSFDDVDALMANLNEED